LKHNCILPEIIYNWKISRFDFKNDVIKIVPGHAFFDTLKCPENAPFSVVLKILGENQSLYCPFYLALATLHNPVQIVIIQNLPFLS
jgi:hypothetical protein